MIYQVDHTTRITYAVPVADAQFNLRLKPVQWPGQSLRDYRLAIAPLPSRQTERDGPYHLATTHIAFEAQLRELEIVSRFTVEIDRQREPDDPGRTVADIKREALQARTISGLSPAPYLFASRIATDSQDIGEWAAQDAGETTQVIPLVRTLASRIHEEFTYKPGATNSATAPSEAFSARHGVCQDFAHVMIMGLRWLGLPAAYASGYLRTVPPPGKEKLVGADAMHAWVNVWCGSELGWVGIDPTNDCFVGNDHIQIAMGRDYADVAPIDGRFIGAAPQAMHSAVNVTECDTG